MVIDHVQLAMRIGGGRPWTAASTAGMGASFVAFDLAGAAAFPLPFSLPFYVVLGGLVVGLLQWRILRRIFGGSGWWVLATPLGWTLAGSTVVLNDRFLPRILGLGGALLYVAVVLAGGVALGLVGGLALHRIVGGRRRSPRGA